MTLQQIVQFIIDVLQAAVAASVIAATPTMQQMTELSPQHVIVFAAGGSPNQAELYYQQNGESSGLGVETWGGHYAPNADCSQVVFSAHSENYGAYMGMVDTHSTMGHTYADIGPDDAEAFLEPRFGPDGESFAAIVQTPTQHQLFVRSKKWGDRIVLVRSSLIGLSDIRWVDDDTIAVTVQAGITMYKKISIPGLFKEERMLKEDFDLLYTPLLLPETLEPTDNTVYAFLCPTN